MTTTLPPEYQANAGGLAEGMSLPMPPEFATAAEERAYRKHELA